MRSKEDLFHLVQAMSKSEKRYFVLDAKKSGRSASRYLSLFDAVNDMEEYDEEPLKKKFAANLSSDKSYLYEAILRSMRDYRSQASKAAQVKERLMDARYLYERGLYDQSTERIMEAKTMAAELEDKFTLLEINREEQVSLFDRRARVQLEHIEKWNEEQEQTLAAIDEELKYLDLYCRLLLEVFREFNLKDERSIEALKKRLPIELLEGKNLPRSPQAIRRFYQCNAVYYNLLGDLEKVYYFSLKAVEWWEDFPILKEEEFHHYVNNVSNLVNTCYKIDGYFSVAQDWFERLKNEKSSGSLHNQKVIFRYLSITKLLYHLNKNEFVAASQLLPEIIEGMNKFGLKKSIALTGNIATVYFLVGDYRNCIKWVDHIVKTMKTGGRQDIQRIVRLYKIIALYELDEVELTELEMRSANRFYKSAESGKESIEEAVLNVYLKQIFNAPLSEYKNSLRYFRTYLTEIKQQPNAENLLGVDELLIWVDSKLK
ncbi:MAG: hypothetical protein HY842_02760 [Bacteroidetes bacterium]|nr:hypothetical protein [Bacteroidota bacterium]